ncbi:YggL family protein, partial [Pseudomonas savastanoi]
MATNRSRRLRKKLCVDEFQELGFELNLDFKQELDDKAIDAFLDAFLKEAMEANGLGYVGGDDFGLVCLSKRGSVSEEQRVAVEAWLKGRSELTEVTVSPLMGVSVFLCSGWLGPAVRQALV